MKKAFKAGQNDVKLNAIVIIDDIYTTGSTIDAMAAVCRQQGVSRIYFAALSIGNGPGGQMINQEKVLRMTKMASYEEHGGRKDRAVVGYFRSDYIGKQTIISLIVITAAFLAGLGAYLVFHFSEVMGNIYSMDLVGTAKKILTLYLMAAVLYVAVTYVIYTIRYAKAKKRLQLFLEYLDCLDQDGEEETAERK